MRQAGLFGLSEHLKRLSKDADPLEVLEATVDFEFSRPWLIEGLGYGDGSKGGRPPFDPVSMFKVLIESVRLSVYGVPVHAEKKGQRGPWRRRSTRAFWTSS